MKILRKFPPPFVFCKLCVHMLVNKKKFERNSSLEYWNDLSWEKNIQTVETLIFSVVMQVVLKQKYI